MKDTSLYAGLAQKTNRLSCARCTGLRAQAVLRLVATDEALSPLSLYARVAGLAPQQAQNTLLIGIGLRKHRSRRLFQYLGSCEVGCL